MKDQIAHHHRLLKGILVPTSVIIERERIKSLYTSEYMIVRKTHMASYRLTWSNLWGSIPQLAHAWYVNMTGHFLGSFGRLGPIYVATNVI